MAVKVCRFIKKNRRGNHGLRTGAATLPWRPLARGSRQGYSGERDLPAPVLPLLRADEAGYSGWPDPRGKRAYTYNYLALLRGGKPLTICITIYLYGATLF